MKVANLNSAWWLNCWWCSDSTALKKIVFNLYLYLVCFVALQVMAKGAW
jgi:hypothetical protein